METNSLSDSELDAVFANSPSSPSVQECPEPDLICRVVFGEATASEIHDLAAHAIHCAHCRKEWMIAKEVFGDQSSPSIEHVAASLVGDYELQSGLQESASEFSWTAKLACRWNEFWSSVRSNHRAVLATTLGLAAVLTIKMPKNETQEFSNYRSADGETSALDQSEGAYGRVDNEFSWPSSGAECAYVVEFLDPQLEVVARSPILGTNSLAIDSALAEKLEGIGSFLWKVTTGGKCKVAHSPLQRAN